MELKEIVKYHEALTEARVKCKHCGHSIVITNKINRVICTWCGNYVFKTDKDEFKFRVKEKIKKK